MCSKNFNRLFKYNRLPVAKRLVCLFIFGLSSVLNFDTLHCSCHRFINALFTVVENRLQWCGNFVVQL